jgi:hypothetical protein
MVFSFYYNLFLYNKFVGKINYNEYVDVRRSGYYDKNSNFARHEVINMEKLPFVKDGRYCGCYEL